MYAKMGIKVYIVLACINLAVWGYIHHDLLWTGLAVMNMCFLFLILIQERAAFAHTGSKRVLFSSDVFFYLAIAVGCVGATLWYNCGSLFGEQYTWIVAFLIGGLFYVLSVWGFRMYDRDRLGDVPHVRLLTILLTGAFVYILGTILPGFGSSTGSVGSWRDGFRSSVKELGTIEEGSTTTSVDTLLAGIRENNLKDDKEDEEDTVDNKPVEEVVVEKSDGDTLPIVSTKNIFSALTLSDETLLTFGNFLPELVSAYDLGPARSDYAFTHIASTSNLYIPFSIARDYTMIGTATHPDQPILCKHLMVLLGLSEEWDITDTSVGVFDAYRNEATQRGYTTTCNDQNTQAKAIDLP